MNQDLISRAQVWASHPGFSVTEREQIRNLIGDPSRREELKNLFGEDLTFGTGGLRGVVGIGTNRMNTYIIRRASRAFAQVLQKSQLPKSVVIGYDSRKTSREFAEAAATTFVEAGLEVYLADRCIATPLVSYFIRELGCGGGINITASHNPPEYNGYKVYWADGAQVTAPNDQRIEREILYLVNWDDALRGSWENVKDKVHGIPEELFQKYYKYLESLLPRSWIEGAPLTIGYSPLHGVGGKYVKEAFLYAKVATPELVVNQAEPDGSFPTVRSPNPENTGALDELVKMCLAKKITYGLATDPDSDRAALIEIQEDQSVQYFTGNQVGAILAEAYYSSLENTHSLPENSAQVRTIVSSRLLDRIGEKYRVKTHETLTGFKFIAREMEWMDSTKSEHFLFAMEESIGYLFGNQIRDKDGIMACLMISGMLRWLNNQNKRASQFLGEIYDKYGIHRESLVNVDAEKFGMSVVDLKKKLEEIRSNYPENIAGKKVLWIRDHEKNARFRIGDVRNYEPINLPLADVLCFELDGGHTVTVRPSGTEPKVKIYVCSALARKAYPSPEAREEMVRSLDMVNEQLGEDLKNKIVN